MNNEDEAPVGASPQLHRAVKLRESIAHEPLSSQLGEPIHDADPDVSSTTDSPAGKPPARSMRHESLAGFPQNGVRIYRQPHRLG